MATSRADREFGTDLSEEGQRDHRESPVRSTKSKPPPRNPLVGLALAGGAPGGAIYEIGAMRALDEALDGFELTQCGCFVGVSAGAFLASCLANGLRTGQQARAIVKREPGEHPFVPEMFFRPAFKEIGKRLLRAPGLLASALKAYGTRREKRIADALTMLGQSLPTGIFDSDPVRDYIERIFSIKGRTDNFNELDCKLTVVTTDLESGEAMRFGHLGWPHVPISVAVQASTALPGLYPPVEINGRNYVDGILLKTMHASVTMEAGAELVFCINPLVPVDTRKAVQQNLLRRSPVMRRGLPAVLSQTVRTMIHSRMSLGLKAYERLYPETDVVLIEPPREDYEDFFSNIFSFASRRAVCEHAYDETRKRLLARSAMIDKMLARHGMRLDLDFLHDETRNVWASVGLPELATSESARMTTEAGTAVSVELEALLERVERLAAANAG